MGWSAVILVFTRVYMVHRGTVGKFGVTGLIAVTHCQTGCTGAHAAWGRVGCIQLAVTICDLHHIWRL